MAIRVYRVAVVGCPRAYINSNGLYEGVGKSCLCNRFVRPESYGETHNSNLSEDEWLNDQVTNGDHFIYWGAATKHLPDGSKARFQIVEQTEFYNQQLQAHSSSQDYLARASALHFKSSSKGKTAYKYKAPEIAVRRVRGPVRNTQLFPNEDFGEKSLGVFGYLCVFDPTLEGKEMESQLSFWSLLLPVLAKRKRKIVIICAKCDVVNEFKIQFASNVASNALKKPVPFIEVSARESVNVEEAFFALVGPSKKHKATKNGKRPLSGYLTFKKVLESRKGDLNRAKDMYRTLLQKRVRSFLNTWSEILPSIEREEAYRSVLELAGADGEETVKKMFQLRLIEIKLMEAGKLYNLRSGSKKLDKGSSQSYQDYLSSAFKGHPDLGNESLYDYVYSPRSSVSDISPTTDSLEALTEPSLPSSYRNTPDLPTSHANNHLPDLSFTEIRPRSSTFQEPSHPGTDLFSSSATLPRTPTRSKTHFLDVKSTAYLSEPPPLPPRAIDVSAAGTLRALSQSQSFVETIPEVPAKQESEMRRLSNSMDCILDGDSAKAKEKRFNELVAEPYLRPVEVKEMMSQVSSPVPPEPSPRAGDPSRHSSVFMSMRVRSKSRPALPHQTTMDTVVQGSPILSRSISFERGHKRSRSNPWVLESSSTKPPQLPPRNIELPPLVPPRPAPLSTSSGSVLSENVISPLESSLDITGRPPLPPTPRKVIPSDMNMSPVSAKKKLKQRSLDDSLSVFEDPVKEQCDSEAVDSPSSPALQSASLAHASSSVKSASLARSARIRELLDDDEDDDPDDPSNQYARIEDLQKYVVMSSAPVTIPRDKTSVMADTESVDHVRRSHTISRSPGIGSQKKDLPSSNSAPLLPWKRKWKKQRNGPIVHETDSAHETSATPSRAQSTKQSPSHERKSRPLPPSPTKPRRALSNKGTGSNIYEAIDDLRPRRQGSRKQEQWGPPPVEPRLWGKYVEAVRKLFAIPAIRDQWLETLKAVMPEENIEGIPLPYTNLPEQEAGSGEGIPPVSTKEPEVDTDQSTPSPVPKLRHKSSVSATPADDTILIEQPFPMSPDQSQSPFRVSLLSASPSSFQNNQTTHSNRVSPFQSPDFRQFKKVRSRDDLIQILNQQLNTRDSLSSDSDSDEEHDSSSSDDDDSDLEDPIQPESTQQQQTSVKEATSFVQTDLDAALCLRASVSTDSDLVADVGSSDPPPPPRPPLPVDMDSRDGVEEVHNIKPSQLIKKRGTPKRRYQSSDVSDAAKNLSDSGISNCHSQTFEDGFSALPPQPVHNNSESEC